MTAVARTAAVRTTVTLALLLALAGGVGAQEANPAAPAPAAPQPTPELSSPRATLATFLRTAEQNDTDRAVACIELEGMTPDGVQTGAPALVFQLRLALDRLVHIKLPADGQPPSTGRWADVPDKNDYAQPFALNLIPGASPAAKVLVLRRGDDGNWRFTNDTRVAVETLFAELAELPGDLDEEAVAEADIEVPFSIRLSGWFPPEWRKTRFLLPGYQWLCLAALLLIGLAADLVAKGLLTLLGNRFWRRFLTHEPDDGADDDGNAEGGDTAPVWRPMGRLVNAAVWYQGAKLIGLPSTLLSVLLTVLQVFTIFAAAWTAFTVIDLVANYFGRRAERTGARFDDLLVPFASRTLKLITIGVGVLTAAQAFGLPLLGLVGGLGLGGAALALASKDAVANFFGSVTVLFDRPFEVGDWIITEGIEGSVESVGFRSTRLRTFNNSLVTLPNSQLTTAAVDNMGARRYRRVKAVLSVEYGTTPDQLDAFCEGVRELIRQHPHTRKDSFHVYFNEFAASSLDIVVYCFLNVSDWGLELQEKHRLYIDIIRLAEHLGVQFAFPTQTLHVASSGGPADNAATADYAASANLFAGKTPREAGRQAAAAVRTTDGGPSEAV